MKRIIRIVLKYAQILKQKMSPPSDVLTATHSGVVDKVVGKGKHQNHLDAPTKRIY